MDWIQIAKLAVEFILGGGLVAVITIRDKKTEAILDNMQKVIREQREMMTHQKGVYDDIILKKDREQEECKAEWKAKEERYESNLARKDDKIERDYKVQSSLRHHLDDANTRAAVCELLKCIKVGCDERDPPLSERMGTICKECGQKETNELE